MIGGEDALGRILAALLRQLLGELGRGGEDLVHRQRRADDPGRADEDVLGSDAERLGRRRAHRLRIGIARCAGAGIGIARVDDDRRRAPAIVGEPLPRHAHRRREELVLGEHRAGRDGRAVLGRDQGHVVAAALDPGVAAGGDEPFSRGDAHGQIPMRGRPAVSPRPSMRFAHWIIWPAAPLTRLSSAAIASTRPVRGS